MLLTTLALLAASAADCRHIGRSMKAARYDLDVLRPGDETGIEYVYRDGPDGEKVIPRQCIKHLEVEGPARLFGVDRLKVLPNATAGEAITLSMRIGDSPYVRTVNVTGADQQVLTGTWSVVESRNCQQRLPAEIRFYDNGGYDFTFPEAMVETMTSGRGTFHWDPATGALSLGGYWRGTARFEGKRVVMEGIWFDIAHAPAPGEPVPPPCRIVLG